MHDKNDQIIRDMANIRIIGTHVYKRKSIQIQLRVLRTPRKATVGVICALIKHATNA